MPEKCCEVRDMYLGIPFVEWYTCSETTCKFILVGSISLGPTGMSEPDKAAFHERSMSKVRLSI